MAELMTTDNYRKHTTTNPVQKKLINNFFVTLVNEVKQLDKVNSILDVGCGEGFTLELLRKQKIGKELVGLEYLDTAIKIGRKVHPKISFKQGSIYELPYKANSFDLVLCTEVLEHLEDPKKALAELARVTKKYAVISVPNEPIFMLGNFLRGKNVSRWGNDIEHIQHWTHLGFKKFVSTKFTILVARTPLPWTLVVLEKK